MYTRINDETPCLYRIGYDNDPAGYLINRTRSFPSHPPPLIRGGDEIKILNHSH